MCNETKIWQYYIDYYQENIEMAVLLNHLFNSTSYICVIVTKKMLIYDQYRCCVMYIIFIIQCFSLYGVNIL